MLFTLVQVNGMTTMIRGVPEAQMEQRAALVFTLV